MCSFLKIEDHKFLDHHYACLSSFLVPPVDSMVEDKYAETFYDVPNI